MELAKKKLLALSQRVHDALRKLKMDEASTISCGDDTPDDVKNYVWAYARHKGKWFDCTYDRTTKTFHVVRAVPPPWKKPADEDDYEEP